MNTKHETRNRKLPFVLINMAMTADGKIATANRAVSTFGSKRDQTHLYELRATADAVMTGARTADLNPIALGTGGERFRKMRLKNRLAEQNLRIIVSGRGTIDPKAHIFTRKFSPIIVLTTGRMNQKTRSRLEVLGAHVKAFGQRQLNFRAALEWLRAKWRVRRLLCEGGGEVNSALFHAGLVDEFNLTVCPKILGGRNAPTIADGAGIRFLSDAAQFRLKSARRVGDEMFLVYTRR